LSEGPSLAGRRAGLEQEFFLLARSPGCLRSGTTSSWSTAERRPAAPRASPPSLVCEGPRGGEHATRPHPRGARARVRGEFAAGPGRCTYAGASALPAGCSTRRPPQGSRMPGWSPTSTPSWSSPPETTAGSPACGVAGEKPAATQPPRPIPSGTTRRTTASSRRRGGCVSFCERATS
jgi:hypothetical protein